MSGRRHGFCGRGIACAAAIALVFQFTLRAEPGKDFSREKARAVAKFGIKGALAASVLVFTLDGKYEFVVVIIFSNRPVIGQVDGMHSGEFEPVTPGVKDTRAGFPLYSLKGFEYRIYHRRVGR